MESARSHVVALGAALLAISAPTHAQRSAKVRPELRVDAIAARATSLQGGVGLAQPFGTYTRILGVVAAGVTTHHGRSVSAGRADLAVRFVLDPFGESRWSLYGTGGISVMYDELDEWRPVVFAALGAEGPRRGTVAPAFELGLGGGVRVGFALRWVRGDLR
ncbi:MAG: hypothetical protein ABI877_01530 [Gemmatimonadaceae bacterium]